MRTKAPTPFPAPDFRDRMERHGWHEYPADIRVRVRRFYRDNDDIIAVEYNGDILHLYKPITNKREAQQVSAKVLARNGKR